jgi:hypothetical protein
MIGSGVSAAFTSQVSAAQNINVGTFSCGIVTATTGATYGAIDTLGYAHTGSYAAPTIMSSDPGSAPFSFTVKNTGSIPDVLTVATSPVSAPWSVINAPFAPVPLASGASNVFNTGVSWTTLDNSELGASGTVTWTVSCGENSPTVIFDNHPSTLPSNLYSIGPEAYSYKEFGAQVQFAGTARKLSTATVTMSSWACEHGGWNTHDCVTTPGATFNVPITFNVYSVGVNNAVGPLIATQTQTFAIPYRPSTSASCSSGGGWLDSSSVCKNGLANNIVFTFSGVTLPDKAIFGITFNTDNYGYSPLHTTGSTSPTDALNVGMYPGGDGTGTTAAAPSVGTFLPDGFSAYLNDTQALWYLDNGAGGVGTFRLDTGTPLAPTSYSPIGRYGSLQPAVQIVASY